MYADRSFFEVFEENGLFGLWLVNSHYVVLPPIYKTIILSWWKSSVDTVDGKRLELLLESYGDDLICLRELQDGHYVFYFINKFGKTVLTIDKEWESSHHYRIGNILSCFMYGVATFELSDSDEYDSFRVLINTEGNVVGDYTLALKKECLNPRDYLNYDGYGLPHKYDPEE